MTAAESHALLPSLLLDRSLHQLRVGPFCALGSVLNIMSEGPGNNSDDGPTMVDIIERGDVEVLWSFV